MQKLAYFGGDNKEYRYCLWRIWDEDKDYVNIIGLNPSTADDKVDDPTIRRCINYATDWGYGALCMTNLFAFRTPSPKEMMTFSGDPIGELNDLWLQECHTEAKVSIAAWGNDGKHLNRDRTVISMLGNLSCLKINESSGKPAHPLYLKKDLKPIPYGM